MKLLATNADGTASFKRGSPERKPVKRSACRKDGDRVMYAQGVAAFVVAMVALLFLLEDWGQQTAAHVGREISTGAAILSLGLVVTWMSSCTDWFYIRPFRDGYFTGQPACQDDRPRRLKWTKYWIIHRSLATVFGVVFLAMGVYLLAFGLLENALGGDDKIPQFLATLPASGLLLLFIQGFGHWEGLRAHNVLATPRFAVGDWLELPSRPDGEFLLTSVALDNVELFDVVSKRTHVYTASFIFGGDNARLSRVRNTSCSPSVCVGAIADCALIKNYEPDAA